LKKDSSRTVTVARAMIDLCNVSPLVISSIDDIVDNTDLIRAQIENCALPYLMKYSSIYSIKEAFELSQEYWPVQNSITRCEVLLAIYILQKEGEKFHQSIEEFREVIRNHRNGYYFEFFCKMTSEMEENYL
jgi:phosphoribosylaminoimidazole carboxylase (NCAIR synthetase)